MSNDYESGFSPLLHLIVLCSLNLKFLFLFKSSGDHCVMFYLVSEQCRDGNIILLFECNLKMNMAAQNDVCISKRC